MDSSSSDYVLVKDIYRGYDKWHFDHLPPIAHKRDHIVLYELPLSDNLSEPPIPHPGDKKWDAHHVRLPCAIQNEYKTESSSDPSKQVTTERWEIIETALLREIKSSRELELAILTYNHKYAKSWKFITLHRLFEDECSEVETDCFFSQVLPNIIQLALQLPDIIPGAIPLLKHNQNKSVSLSQKRIACLLANAFLCTFPRRNDDKGEYSSYPNINFSTLYQADSPQNLEKLKCIFNYLRRVCNKMPTGVVTFSRRSISSKDLPKWNECQLNFANSMLHVDDEGRIENGEGLLQVDFANKYLCGGVLNYGCVQEEIRFMICPELLCSRLFTENLSENECMTISGCERFNSYSGYASSFTWTGDYTDTTPIDSSGRRKCTIVAIDAIKFKFRAQQFKDDMIKRELNKAYVGFKHDLATPAPGVATGNWGCGAFNGDKHLKSLLQLMTCCLTKRPVVYYTFGDETLRSDLLMMFEFLSQNEVTIAQLWSYLKQYSDQKCTTHLYEFIISCHQESRIPRSNTNNQSPTQALRPVKSPISETPQNRCAAEAMDTTEHVEPEQFIIENSNDDEQFSVDEAMSELAANALQQILPKSTAKATAKATPEPDRKTDTCVQPSPISSTPKILGVEKPVNRTIDSYFSPPLSGTETNVKRSRSLLVTSLDEDFNRYSPAKLSRTS